MSTIPFLRTPNSRFENLPDYPFEPNYCEQPDGLRMHYVDANPSAKEVIVCLHGEPSWSYLYRKMIPLLTAGGYRVIAPDLIGFGKSDKPTETSDYTYQRHMDWVQFLLFEHLQLNNIHLFVQDWGGLIGLRLLAEQPDRFGSATAANTFLPTGDRPLGEAFEQWQQQSQVMNPFPVGKILQFASVSELPAEVEAAYDAPFPDESYKAGARIFPMLVPTSPDDPAAPANRTAWKKLGELELPFLTLFSDQDPIMSGAEKYLQAHIPGTKGQPHATIQGGGHFLQEDQPDDIVKHLLAFLAKVV